MRRVKVLALAAGERDLANRMRVWFGGISVKEREAIMGREASLTPPDPYPFSSTLSSLTANPVLRSDLVASRQSARARRPHDDGGSIEGRMPFMDVELANVVARFPDRFLVGTKSGKAGAAGKYAEAVAASELCNRKKVGFRVPFGRWVRGPYRDFAYDMLDSEASQGLRAFAAGQSSAAC